MKITNDIISLWIGQQSKNCANEFYSIQAEQIFDQKQDIINHGMIWKSLNKKKQLNPKMIIYNDCIPQLCKLRQVNLTKMMNQMNQSESSMTKHFPIQIKQNQILKQSNQFNNWNSNESNYVLIDTNFTKNNHTYNHWQQLYKIHQQQYEQSIRKQLQKLDYLQAFTVCSDESMIGFTQQIINYLKDQLTKITIIMSAIQIDQSNLYNMLPTIGQISPEVDIFMPVRMKYDYPFFSNGKYNQIASLFSSLYTPFLLKQANLSHYVQSIVPRANQNIFNTAYTLPMISSSLLLEDKTNIFQYNKPSMNHAMLNWGNKNYLSFDGMNQKGLLCESYILKGHFNYLEDKFRPRTKSVSLKYLQGIFSNNTKNGLQYSSLYEDYYKKTVNQYPLHLVMFQHCNFGNQIRKYISSLKLLTQVQKQWFEKVLEIADKYCQVYD